MGIGYAPLNPAIAAQLNITAKDAVVIGKVVQGSPTATAGLQAGDVITAIGGAALPGDSALSQMVEKHKPGDTITLTVLRSGQTHSIKLVLGELPSP